MLRELYGGFAPDAIPGLAAHGWTQDAPPPPDPAADRIALGEGGWGYRRAVRDELTVLARNNRASGTFYEDAQARASRARALTAALTASDPGFITALVADLRSSQRLRTAAITVAVDATVAGHPDAQELFAAALLRADDPVAALSYFNATYSSPVPQGLRKGLADAATRLYNQQSTLAYDRARTTSVDGATDSALRARFRDVIRVAHPTPSDPTQSTLFAYLAGGAKALTDDQATALPHLARVKRLQTLSPPERAEVLTRSHAAATAALAAGYVSSQAAVSEAGVLPWRDLAAWVPKSDEYRAARAAATAAATAAKLARFDANTARYADRDARKRLAKLVSHQSDDQQLLGTNTVLAAAERETIQARIDARAEVIDTAREELRHVSVASDAAYVAHDALERQRRDAAAELAELSGGTAELWETAIPQMGYKDTLRSLAAFERAGISQPAQAWAEARLADPAAAADSTLLLSDVAAAIKTLGVDPSAPVDDLFDHDHIADPWLNRYGSMGEAMVIPADSRWNSAIDAALQTAADPVVPHLPGKVLVLVDGSGSMTSPVTPRENDQRAATYASLERAEVAALFAGLIANRAEHADVYGYDTVAHKVELPGSTSDTATIRSVTGALKGGGTDTWGVVLDTWDEHDTIVILTDEETSWTGDQPQYSSYYRRDHKPLRETLPTHVNVITCNLAGGAASHAATSRHTVLSGVTEQLFVELAAATGATTGAPAPVIG
jgi:hypothetical protein